MLTGIIFLLLCIVGLYRAFKHLQQSIRDHRHGLVVVDVLVLAFGLYLLWYIISWLF